MGVMDDALAELDPQSFIEVFVPGRICLIGEHSDWAGHYRRFNSDVEKGYCIVSGTNQGLYARVYPHPNRLIMRCVVDTGEVYEDSLPMDPAVLRQRAQVYGRGPAPHPATVCCRATVSLRHAVNAYK